MDLVINWLQNLASQVSLPLFVIIGVFVEEVVAPIPSPLVMTLAGSISLSQNQPWIYLFYLAVIGAISKTIGSYLIYKIADKLEDIVIDKFGRFLGVSHSDTEGLGKFLSKGNRDDLALFLMRALPIVPTAPVSIISGLIKTDIKTYLISTFLGLLVRNSIYLYVGHASFGALESLNQGFDSLENIGYLFILSIILMFVIWIYRKRKHGSHSDVLEKLLSKFKI